ncbi:hypothetical protein BGZ74_001489 [Mortierella antarctica]|nr:hypothetical protein BGZ74_001489 [Mortierella antarctica]
MRYHGFRILSAECESRAREEVRSNFSVQSKSTAQSSALSQDPRAQQQTVSGGIASSTSQVSSKKRAAGGQAPAKSKRQKVVIASACSINNNLSPVASNSSTSTSTASTSTSWAWTEPSSSIVTSSEHLSSSSSFTATTSTTPSTAEVPLFTFSSDRERLLQECPNGGRLYMTDEGRLGLEPRDHTGHKKFGFLAKVIHNIFSRFMDPERTTLHVDGKPSIQKSAERASRKAENTAKLKSLEDDIDATIKCYADIPHGLYN